MELEVRTFRVVLVWWVPSFVGLDCLCWPGWIWEGSSRMVLSPCRMTMTNANKQVGDGRCSGEGSGVSQRVCQYPQGALMCASREETLDVVDSDSDGQSLCSALSVSMNVQA